MGWLRKFLSFVRELMPTRPDIYPPFDIEILHVSLLPIRGPATSLDASEFVKATFLPKSSENAIHRQLLVRIAGSELPDASKISVIIEWRFKELGYRYKSLHRVVEGDGPVAILFYHNRDPDSSSGKPSLSPFELGLEKCLEISSSAMDSPCPKTRARSWRSRQPTWPFTSGARQSSAKQGLSKRHWEVSRRYSSQAIVTRGPSGWENLSHIYLPGVKETERRFLSSVVPFPRSVRNIENDQSSIAKEPPVNESMPLQVQFGVLQGQYRGESHSPSSTPQYGNEPIDTESYRVENLGKDNNEMAGRKAAEQSLKRANAGQVDQTIASSNTETNREEMEKLAMGGLWTENLETMGVPRNVPNLGDHQAGQLGIVVVIESSAARVIDHRLHASTPFSPDLVPKQTTSSAADKEDDERMLASYINEDCGPVSAPERITRGSLSRRPPQMEGDIDSTASGNIDLPLPGESASGDHKTDPRGHIKQSSQQSWADNSTWPLSSLNLRENTLPVLSTKATSISTTSAERNTFLPAATSSPYGDANIVLERSTCHQGIENEMATQDLETISNVSSSFSEIDHPDNYWNYDADEGNYYHINEKDGTKQWYPKKFV